MVPVRESPGKVLLSARGVYKRFGSVVALAGASLEVAPREVHAVVGENGAGKTTLMNVLAGMIRPDAGEVHLDGRPVSPRSAAEARALGVGMVHQHFTLVPALTAAENFLLARVSGGRRPDLAGAARRLHRLAEETGLVVPPRARVGELPVGIRQRLEILRELEAARSFGRAPILILDEPTAVLAPDEVHALFPMLRRLARRGGAVLLITHKLREVARVADRATVLREGRTVWTGRVRGIPPSRLAQAMVGRAIRRRPPRPLRKRKAGPPVLEARGLRVRGDRGEWVLDGVDLDLRRGEITGVAGVEGNGQRPLVRALLGLQPFLGSVRGDFERAAFIPQDRQTEGLLLDRSIAENLALRWHRDPGFRKGPWGVLLDWKRIREAGRVVMNQWGIRAPNPDVPVRTLSGGNQQRVVLGRELTGTPSLLVAEDPTRGLDWVAEAFIRDRIRQERNRGAAALLVSTDLDEVLSLSDRVAVAYRGKLSWTGRVRERVAAAMAGLGWGGEE